MLRSTRINIFKTISRKEWHFLAILISINFIIKSIVASAIDLGNDEVYYWTYALFPDWSHFDHPPMVGLVIQLFSLNLLLHSEFFIRLGSLVLSSANIVLLFLIVKKVYSVRAAYISALLFTASIYYNVITGLFILPDTPLVFFSLLALYFGIPAITSYPSKENSSKLLLFGLFTGLALLSKYNAIFLWVGFGLFILIRKKEWLRKSSLYLSIVLSLILLFPIIYWNVENHFISFTFHAARINTGDTLFSHSSFISYNLGQFFYQNPVLFFFFILTLITLFRKNWKSFSDADILLLSISIPMILVLMIVSLFSNLLPHWSGPAFIGLIILCSGWLDKLFTQAPAKVYSIVIGANLFTFLIIGLGVLQIDEGLIYSPGKKNEISKESEADFSLDMYGWKQAKVKFEQFLQKEEGITPDEYNHVKILTNNWFPAAHLDFYIAQPLRMELLVTGDLLNAHKYYWINQTRHIHPGDRLYYITTNVNYYDPQKLKFQFKSIVPEDTIKLVRNHKVVKNLYIYEMRGPVVTNLIN